MSKHHYYLTTTLPYVNADPHIGFALEIVEADVIARYQRMLGKEVVFNTGTDEHGQKIYRKAQELKTEPQHYVDQAAEKFKELKSQLNLSFTHFTRTTNPDHIKAAQQFWQLAQESGDIYLADYPVKYCVGCELAKTDSELVDGRCPLHPDQELEIRQEENYFFRFSQYQQPLLDLYQNNPEFVKPAGKHKEITSFVEQGLKDFSISRLKQKMPWGIPVPNDDKHVMYVWFDALVNYISALGWPNDLDQYKQYWPGVQLAGKDNLRQQAAMWQAMLMSAQLPNSEQILINGFINVAGQKMSKSLGNAISPKDMTDRYGIEAARFLLISLGVFSGDMDVTWDKFDQKYTAELANGIGNLCSRVAKMAAGVDLEFTTGELPELSEEFKELMNHYQLTAALDWVSNLTSLTDQYLSKTKPWEQSGQEKVEVLTAAIRRIITISTHLQPFMPDTAKKIGQHFTGKIEPIAPLFPRVN